MKIKLLTFILLIITFAGCKKNDILEYPINFYGDKIVVQSKTRLFSKNGEIKDPAKIADFTAGLEEFSDAILATDAAKKTPLY